MLKGVKKYIKEVSNIDLTSMLKLKIFGSTSIEYIIKSNISENDKITIIKNGKFINDDFNKITYLGFTLEDIAYNKNNFILSEYISKNKKVIPEIKYYQYFEEKIINLI